MVSTELVPVQACLGSLSAAETSRMESEDTYTIVPVTWSLYTNYCRLLPEYGVSFTLTSCPPFFLSILVPVETIALKKECHPSSRTGSNTYNKSLEIRTSRLEALGSSSVIYYVSLVWPAPQKGRPTITARITGTVRERNFTV